MSGDEQYNAGKCDERHAGIGRRLEQIDDRFRSTDERLDRIDSRLWGLVILALIQVLGILSLLLTSGIVPSSFQ